MIDKTKTIFLIAAIAVSSICSAQNYLALSTPDSLLKNANAVIRQSYTNATIKPGSATYTIEETITIFNNLSSTLFHFKNCCKITNNKTNIQLKWPKLIVNNSFTFRSDGHRSCV